MSESLDEPLACTECLYDLRGSAGPRCPECGTQFDAQKLREWWTQTQRVTAWEQRPSIGGFVATWIQVATAPRRFARRFPLQHDSNRGLRYSVACYVLGATTILVASAARSKAEFGLLFVAAGLAGVFACDFLLGIYLGALGPPVLSPRQPNAFHFWRGLAGYGSGFAVVSAIWAAVAIYVREPFLGNAIFEWIALAILAWWWATLSVMIVTRGTGWGRRLAAVAVIPVIATMSIFAGYMTAVIIFVGLQLILQR